MNVKAEKQDTLKHFKHWLHPPNSPHTCLNPKIRNEFPRFFYFWELHMERQSRSRGKAEHTSLSASTYKRLSFILLKCCLINVPVTLNISTAGGPFVIVEMAGWAGPRWELLPHTGVDVWAAGRSRRAHVINNPACGWEPERGRAHEQSWDLMNYKPILHKNKKNTVMDSFPPKPESDSSFEASWWISGWKLQLLRERLMTRFMRCEINTDTLSALDSQLKDAQIIV